MKTILFSLGLIASLASPLQVFAQGGSLTPPGAPAPTMKTLDQIEPRIPITSLPFTITQSGSYYLTKSFAQNFIFDAITIRTNDVTLDLCGFTIRQTGVDVVSGLFVGAAPNIPLRNATIRNGTITGFPSSGVKLFGTRNCVVERLTVTDCNLGITSQPYGTAATVGNTIRHCRTCDNVAGSGIAIGSGAGSIGNVIEYCESLNNSTGFVLGTGGGNLIIGCRASGNTGNNYTINTGNRMGLIVLPGVNAAPFNGSSGGTGTGTTDPFANLSY